MRKKRLFDFLNYGADKLQIFFLIIFRLSGLFIIAPIFSDRSYPPMVKVGLAVTLALLLVTVIEPVQIVAAGSLIELTGMALKEVMVGLILGLFFQILFFAAATGGSLIGYQVGLAMANEFDPNMSSQVSLIGRFWTLVATMIFFAINGHHLVIQAFVDSYRVIPPGSVALDGEVGRLIIKYTAYVYIIALKIAAPVMITLFLTDVALGALSKTIPTMNVFFVGFPIKIATGLAVIALSLPIAVYVLEKTVGFLDRELQVMLAAMGSA